MTQEQDNPKTGPERLTRAYELMLQRVEHSLEKAAAGSEAVLGHALDTAREKAIELGELTREEAERVHDFVSRDLYDAGRHLATQERELADWLRLGLLSVETGLLKRFSVLAQTAKLELRHLEKARRRLDEWHTGEVTGIGTLRCRACGEVLHFERIGRIPPCPRCHASVYERVKD